LLVTSGRITDDVLAAVLRLDFDYDGVTVRAGDPMGIVYDEPTLRRIVRDRAAEGRARRTLEGLGAIELDCLDDCAAPHGAEIDYVLRLDGDVHALCGFSAYGIPQLAALGWRVEIDPAYPWQVVDAAAPLSVDVEPIASRPDWFGLHLGIEVDGHRVDLLPPLLELIEGAASLDALGRLPRKCVAVQIAERRWLPIPPERLRLLLEVLRELHGDGPAFVFPKTQAALVAQLGAALHDATRPVRWRGATELRDHGYALALGPRGETAPPRGLQAQLRPYQQDGVAWLAHLRSHDAGGVLADDMGLGKTLQTIAHLLAEHEAGRLDAPALVVTPTSLVGNWQRELARFAPSLRVLTLRGPLRHGRFAEIPDHDVVLTTYPLLARDRDTLAEHGYHLLVLDEAQTIKNAQCSTHDAARAITARHRVCLTGTPIENHLGELWALMDFCNPGLLGDADRFKAEFRVPIEQHGDAPRLVALRERVRPYLLRRTKDAVAPELPPKTMIVRAVDLGGAQRELYESIRIAAHADVREHLRTRGLAGSTIQVLDALLKLRQVCCDPRLVAADAAQAAVASGESAKLELLLELVTQQLGQGRRLLVFSQFARMLALISEGLLGRGVGHVTLTGSTPDRQKPIDAFERGKADVFLISLKAGGVGLNLTSADTVIHYDPWWNPTAQAQATDRAHRIGQKKPVFVYDLIVAGSVEERMLGLQAHKRRLADAILTNGGTGPATLTERDVEDLLAPLA